MSAHEHQRDFTFLDLLAHHDLGEKIYNFLDLESRSNLCCTSKAASAAVSRRVKGVRFGPLPDTAASALLLAFVSVKYPALRTLSIDGGTNSWLDALGAMMVAVGGGGVALSARLEKLQLESARLSAEEASALFSALFPRLHTLDLNHTKIAADGIAALATAAMPRLRSLNLSGGGLTSNAIILLSNAEWESLEELDISENVPSSPSSQHETRQLCAAAFGALATSRVGQSVGTLRMDLMRVPKEVLSALIEHPWPRLTYWSAECGVAELRECGAAFAAPSSMVALRELRLRSYQLSPEVANALAARTSLEHLDVSLFDNDRLPECEWATLSRLTVSGNRVAPAALFPSVRRLKLRWGDQLPGSSAAEWIGGWAQRLEVLEVEVLSVPHQWATLAAGLTLLSQAEWRSLRTLRCIMLKNAYFVELHGWVEQQYRAAEQAMRAKCPLLETFEMEMVNVGSVF